MMAYSSSYDLDDGPTPPSTLKWAIVALRISAVVYFILGLLLIVLLVLFANEKSKDIANMVVLGATMILSFGFGIFVWIMTRALEHGRFWAWVAALAVSGLYTPSCFLPFAVFGFIGLLSEDSRVYCGVGAEKPVERGM